MVPQGWHHHSLLGERVDMWPERCPACGNFRERDAPSVIDARAERALALLAQVRETGVRLGGHRVPGVQLLTAEMQVGEALVILSDILTGKFQ